MKVSLCMSRTMYAICHHFRLGRPYYVLPVVATAIAGYWSGSDTLPVCTEAGLVSVVFFLLGMSCWAANEITDRQSDARGRTKTRWPLYVSGGTNIISTGMVSVRSALIYVVSLSTVGLSIAASLGISFCCLSALFLLIGLAYSFKPVRLKERGILGLAAVAAAYGMVTFTAGWVASGQHPTGECFLFACILSVGFFGFEGIAHLLDHEQDRRNDETTMAVSLGCETTRNVLAICQCLPPFALMLLGVLAQSPLPDLNIVLLVPLLFLSAFIATLTAKCQNEASLCSLRVFSVPLMSILAFLIA